jgi:hypothetical protein
MPQHGQLLPAEHFIEDYIKSLDQCPYKLYSEAKAHFLANHHPSYTPQEIEQRLIDLANEYGI